MYVPFFETILYDELLFHLYKKVSFFGFFLPLIFNEIDCNRNVIILAESTNINCVDGSHVLNTLFSTLIYLHKFL